MKKIITTALAMMVAVQGYSQTTNIFPANGDVGIGTTAPLSGGGASKWLTVEGATTYSGGIIYSVNGIPKGYSYYNNASDGLRYQAATGVPISFQPNCVTALTLNTSGNAVFAGSLTGTSATFNGNVGVGTISPYRFQVQASGTNPDALELVSAFRKSSVGGGELAFRVHDGLVDILSTYEATANNIDMSFTTTKSNASQPERMRIQASTGNVGIGITNPEFKIDVSGDGRIGKSILTWSNSPFTNSSIYYSSTGQHNMFGVDGSWSTKYFGLKADGTFVTMGGNVGIGTTDPRGYKLAVAGNVIAESVKVALQGNWPDYVFNPENKLLSLSEIEIFVQSNKHLPEMPSEAEVKKEGINLGQMDAKLLKKIEELTLYMIDLKKEMATVKQENQILKKKVAQLEEAK